MKLAVIGAGYVGSVTGAAFADAGHACVIIDVDPGKVRAINAGKSPIYEPGLEEVIRRAVEQRNLSATESFEAVREADAVFIAVGTPSLPNGEADLQYVRSAARSAGQHLNPDKFTAVVNKSTVPVGTSELVAALIEEESGLRSDEHFAVVSNPEFLREGYALQDVMNPDRIVIGTHHPEARRMMRALYRRWIEREAGAPVYFETDPKSAELVKYASNAFLSVKVSFINEVARFCEAVGANALDVAKGMGLDPRIGAQYLQISSGWSGSCLPKDTAELLAASRKYKCGMPIVEAAVESNLRMHEYCVEKVRQKLKTLAGKRIGILGLTFKPDTDDARKTQASYIIGRLLELGAAVSAHDPKGIAAFREMNPHLRVRYCEQAEDAADKADAIVLLTHWAEYARLDWPRVHRNMRNPYILDTRNFLLELQLAELGFHYEGIGL
jgi:UDPglucose 6-dehydrogenase